MVFKVPISLIFLPFRWKVESFSNTKFQKLNSFSQFLLRFFDYGKVQIRQFWDSCRFGPSIHFIMKSWCDDVEEGACAASGWILTLSTQQFLRLRFKTQRKTEKFSFKYVLLLLGHRYQSSVARSKLNFLTFFDKKAYFGFSNSEFINDNNFSLKEKKQAI